jgi:hypothetical protein
VRVQRRFLRGLIGVCAAVGALVALTSAQGGAFAGANGPIAYTCGANICQANADGSGKFTLIQNASDPSWSQDGTQIAYVANAHIVVANDDGTSPLQLADTAGATQPSFSFDGFDVAYTEGGDIHTTDSANFGGEDNLTNSTAADADPAYSPDGSTIAYSSNAGGTFDIWTISSDPASSASPVHITTGSGNEQSPSWSPGGGSIVYVANVAGSSTGELFTVNATPGATPTDLGVRGSDPAYSPDGARIAYVTATGQLATINANGSGSQTVDASTTNSQPDWQRVDTSGVSGSGPPRNISYPTINLGINDSTPVVGHFLTASVGTWDGAFPITYTYQWKRCDAGDPLNGPCFNIPGATFSLYTPVAADSGQRLRVQVTATNGQGSASQNSESSAVVVALAVKVRSTPQISDDSPVVDSPLFLSAGVWDGSTPIAFTYSWRRCNPVGDLATCVEIPGATKNTYTPTLQDIGFSLRVWITGTNVTGSDTAITNHTFPVVDKPHFAPSTVDAPEVNGSPVSGRQLTADTGSFDGDEPIQTSYTWNRCDATGAACHVIANAKKIIYVTGPADIGYTIRIFVTATNAYGNMVAQSPATDAISAAPPNVKGRHIVGTSKGEYLAGGGHDDWIEGMGGNDTLLGGAGDDRIDGGTGADVITGGAGADKLNGGDGSDTIFADDGERDIIDCGAGNDRAVVDPSDKVTNCEMVERSSSSGGSGGSSGSGGSGGAGGSGGSGGATGPGGSVRP